MNKTICAKSQQNQTKWLNVFIVFGGAAHLLIDPNFNNLYNYVK